MLDSADKNGVSQRDHLISAFKSTGRLPALLAEEPDLPEEIDYLWWDHLRLRRSGFNGIGIASVTFSELLAYSQLYGVSFTGWELDALISLDEIRIKYQQKARDAQ